MRICLDDDCGVHTYMKRVPLTRCPGCDKPGNIVPCPECLGTGMRAVPGRDKTLVCTGCDYKIDLDVEAPAFLGWVEKMTEQSNLEQWGTPPATHLDGAWTTAPEGSIQWHLDGTREQVRQAMPHDLSEFDEGSDIYFSLFLRSLGDAPVDPNATFVDREDDSDA